MIEAFVVELVMKVRENPFCDFNLTRQEGGRGGFFGETSGGGEFNLASWRSNEATTTLANLGLLEQHPRNI